MVTKLSPKTIVGSGLAVTLAMFATVFPSVPVHAQNAGAGASETQLEEIVVRGRQDRDSHLALFGDLSTREIPLGINIIGADQISRDNAKSLERILLTDPAYTSSFGSSALSSGVTNGFLRGFYISRYMSNGVPQNYSWNITPAEVTERVEVLRGPSAFSYGFMSPGGAINIVTKSPPDENFAVLRASIDEFSKAGAHLDFGGRVGDEQKLGYRLNLAMTKGDTFLSNTDQDRKVAGGVIDYRFSDRTVLSLHAERVDTDTNGEIEGNRRVFDVDGNLVQGLGQEVPVSEPYHFYNLDITTAGLQLATSIADNIDLTTKLYYSDYGEAYFNFYDYGDLNSQGIGTIEQGFGNYYIDDLNFTSFLNGRFGSGRVQHSVTLGVTAADSEYTATWSAEAGVGSWFDVGSFLPDTYTQPVAPYSVLQLDEYGVMLSDVIEIDERWRMLLGARWSSQEGNETSPEYDEVYPEEKNDEVTPLLGVMYDIRPHLSVYANYATGLERGGRAPLDALNANQQMPAVVSEQYEAGLKWQVNGDRATVDFAVFQISRPSEFYQGPGTLYVQDGEQRNSGAEVVFQGWIAETLRVAGGVQYLDAEIRETADPAAIGSAPWGVPEWQGTVSAEWQIEALPGFSLLALVTGKSERQLSVPNDQRTGPGYGLGELGARYQFEIAGKPASAQIRVENVTDKEYAAGSGYLFGVPRTVWAAFEFDLW